MGRATLSDQPPHSQGGPDQMGPMAPPAMPSADGPGPDPEAVQLQQMNDGTKYTSQHETDTIPPVAEWRPQLNRQCTAMCAGHTLAKRLPITKWLPSYKWNFLLPDIIAGLTVGLTAIPQGLAYAVVAGLQPQYGLYAGFMGSFTYFLFGSTKDITVGPTAIMALMTQTYVMNFGADFAVLLAFLSGCIILLFGILQLGFLVDFISMPVTVGFTSAAAVTIGTSQLKGLFGLHGAKSDKFMDSLVNFFKHIHEAQLWDSVLGISTIIALLLMQRLKALHIKTNHHGRSVSKTRVIFGQAMWLISLCRNAIVVFLGVGIAYVLHLQGLTPFALTGNIANGLPPFSLPPFSTVYHNETLNFLEMTSKLGSSLIALPLIAILESVAIAKAFLKGKALDATQEMIALGLCNISGSFFRSMPVTGSFTRTAVNNASGVKTQAGGVFTGLLVLAALGLLTSTFYFIPKATLSGLIITAMFFMVEFEVVPLLWRSKRLDLIPLAATFIFCLLIGLEYGMIVGITVNLLILLYDTARPTVEIKWTTIEGNNVLMVTPAQSLAFPSAEYVREVIVKHCNDCEDNSQQSAVVIDGSHLLNIDSTVAKVLKLLAEDLNALKIPLHLWRWPLPVKGTLLGIDCKMEHLFKDESSLEMLFCREHIRVGNGDILPIEDNQHLHINNP